MTEQVIAFPTVTIRTEGGGVFAIPAEPTEVPGLYVTPEVWLAHLSAGVPPFWRPSWKLTHGPSGVAMPYRGRTPEHIRELAHALAAVRADWSDLPADRGEWPAGFEKEVNRAGGVWECRRHRLQQPVFFWPVSRGASA